MTETKPNRQLINCVVPSCSTKTISGLFRFPTDPVLKKKWCDIFQIHSDVGPSRRVCHKHFSEDAFFHNKEERSLLKKYKLKKGVVPSLNLPNQRKTSSDSENLILKSKIRIAKRTSNLKCESCDIFFSRKAHLIFHNETVHENTQTGSLTQNIELLNSPSNIAKVYL